MSLPTSRNTTYAAGSQLKSTDLDAIQDCIIGNKKPTTQRVFIPTLVIPGAFAAGAEPGYVVSGSNTPGACIMIPAEVGDRITGLTFAAFGNGVATCISTLFAGDGSMPTGGAGTSVQLGTVNDNGPRGAAWGDVALGGFVPTTIGAGQFLFLRANPSAGAYRIGRIILTYDRL